MTTRRGRRSGPRRSRKRTVWNSATVFNITLADGAESVSDLFGGLTTAEKNDVGTVLRVIGSFDVRSATAGNIASGRFGLVLVTDDALAGTTVPDPLQDVASSWLLNRSFFQEDAANVPRTYEFDVRSQRRLPGNEYTIAIVVQSDVGSTVGSLNFGFAMRVLYRVK